MELAAKHYADALFAIALENQSDKKYVDDLETFVKDLDENKEFFQLLTHPKIDKDEKKDILKKIYQQEFDQYMINFLCILIDRSRFSQIKYIYLEFVKLYQEEHDIQVVKVYSPNPLKESDKNKLLLTLKDKLKKEICLEEYIDTSLIAGVKMVINDKVFDNSVNMRLEKMKKMRT